MGAAFKIPILETETLEDDLKLMRSQGVELAATILDPQAEPLRHATRPARFGLLFGNEATGLDELWIALCDRRLTIPMSGETDSLNVAIAAGIFLHHFAIDEESAAGAPAK
jgi:tRNA G18 (ribose-2'-O)-methylase SpoU